MDLPCAQELCPHWTGDGKVCGCELLGLSQDERIQACKELLDWIRSEG